MAWLALISASEGRRAGFAAVAGVASGLVALGAASAFGLAQLASTFPLFFSLLRYTGVLYLLWLAWVTWRSSEEPSFATVKTGVRSLAWIRHGLLLNLLNPKAAIFFIALVPAYIVADQPVMPQTLALSASYVAIATLIHIAIVLLAAQAHDWLVTGGRQRRVRQAFAVMLAGIAIWFLITTR